MTQNCLMICVIGQIGHIDKLIKPVKNKSLKEFLEY